tara:strand:- start:161 stop:1252 length:1092 start_codon:yes stop_codon:yes gene_type:complete
MAESKKLIVFIPSIEDGGVEKNLYIILNSLSKKINDITLITYDNSKKNRFNKKIKILNPFFNLINFKGRYPKYFFCLTVLIKILLFRKNNLVLSFQANIFAIIASTFFKTPIISRSNSSSAGWSNNKIKQKIFKFYFKKANKIIVNSYQFKKEMDNKYGINSECILNPFEFNKIKKLSNEKSQKIFGKKKNLKLISVGRLTDQKDFETMINVIKHVKRNVQLVIIGKGRNYDSLKNYINELKLSNKINFIGYKKNPFKYVKQADIFILTSKFEGSPNVLVEAQYLKKYIISTNCPTGPKEILNNGKYGSLVRVGDHKSIAKILQNYIYSKPIKKKIKLGYLNTKKYDYKIACKKYFDLIQRYI